MPSAVCHSVNPGGKTDDLANPGNMKKHQCLSGVPLTCLCQMYCLVIFYAKQERRLEKPVFKNKKPCSDKTIHFWNDGNWNQVKNRTKLRGRRQRGLMGNPTQVGTFRVEQKIKKEKKENKPSKQKVWNTKNRWTKDNTTGTRFNPNHLWAAAGL